VHAVSNPYPDTLYSAMLEWDRRNPEVESTRFCGENDASARTVQPALTERRRNDRLCVFLLFAHFPLYAPPHTVQQDRDLFQNLT
jgi:hypothetical protein